MPNPPSPWGMTRWLSGQPPPTQDQPAAPTPCPWRRGTVPEAGQPDSAV